MPESKNIKLIPDQETKSEEFFKTKKEYDDFCRNFVEDIEPDLERQRKARQESVAEAKHRWIR
jgi:hypothetical protein